jgi:hypothetical protein
MPLYDAGFTIEFDATTVRVRLQNQLLLKGQRDSLGLLIFQLSTQPVTGLMDIDASVSQVNSTIGAPNAAELIAYAHATLFSLALNTLQKALRQGYIHNFPGLTSKMLQCHQPQSVATAKGHLDQIRQNLYSTYMNPRISLSLISMMHSLPKSHLR